MVRCCRCALVCVAAAVSVESGPEAEYLSPLALATEAPQVVEAELMLPLQVSSPTFSSPKAAGSPDPGTSRAESEAGATRGSAAGTLVDISKSVASLPVPAGSSSSVAASEPLVGITQLPLGPCSAVTFHPVSLPSSPLQKAAKKGLRRTVLTVEGPTDLLPLPLAELTPEATPPKATSSAPTPPPEKP